jgi:streptomycin 6-kinase
MEQLWPGTSLKHLIQEGKDEQATRIIAQTILDLQSMDPLHQANLNYQPISEHIDSLDFLQKYLDHRIIDSAKSIFKELCASSTKNIILHGDLHHDNILQNSASWDVIDPHGYIGDPCAEVGPMIFNPLDCFPQHLPLQNIIQTRLKILDEMLPFDLERIKAWAFCLTLRSAGWDVEGFGSPNYQTLEIAKILRTMRG